VTREKTTIVNNVDGTTTQREKTTKGKNMIGKKWASQKIRIHIVLFCFTFFRSSCLYFL